MRQTIALETIRFDTALNELDNRGILKELSYCGIDKQTNASLFMDTFTIRAITSSRFKSKVVNYMTAKI